MVACCSAGALSSAITLFFRPLLKSKEQLAEEELRLIP